MPATAMFDRSRSDLTKLTSVKWSLYDADVIPLFVAEMDFGIAEPVREAISRVIDNVDLGYPDVTLSSRNRLAVSFCERMSSQFGWQPAPEDVIPVADLVQGTYAPVTVFSEPGDGVIVQVPCYPPFRNAVVETGRRFIPMSMQSDGERHGCDFAAMEQLIDSRTRIIILCNPHNPTGRVFDREELLELGRIAEEHDLIVISDEIHADLVYAGHQHIPFASLGPEFAARCITLNSPTKSFNFPGLRAAVMHFGSRRLRDRFLSRMPYRLLGQLNTLGVEATVAAWGQGQPWLDAVMGQLVKAKAKTAKLLTENIPEIRFHDPEATYLMWLDCRDLDLPSAAYDFFLHEAGVAFSAGGSFDPTCNGFVRLNFATTEAILVEAVERMVAAIDQHRRR